MAKGNYRFITIPLIFAAGFLCIRWLFPLVFPFLLGFGLAVLAEPMTKFLCKKLPRGLSAAISVTAVFCFLMLTIVLLGALLVRQLGLLPSVVPDLENAASAGMDTLSSWLQGLTRYAPGALGDYLRQTITGFFSGSNALLDQVTGYLLNLAGGILSHVPDSALGIGTALISSYMFAAKLPGIRAWIRERTKNTRLERLRSGLKQFRSTIGHWLLAQIKLSGIALLILAAGFLLLRISYAPLWAILVALVDTFPVLGTGTVLIPWSLVCLLQGDTARGIGLLGVYTVVTITRSMMEPKLVGKHLGLDPLATLFALYAGYKLWGLPGMLLAPMIAAIAAQFLPRNDKL